MARINQNGPAQGGPPVSTEGQNAAQQGHNGALQAKVPAALRNAENQAQASLADMLAQQKKKLSAADTERLVSQAGYQRGGAKKRHRALDIGDSMHAPIPLPGDDTDGAEWSQNALQDAQEEFSEQGAAFFEAARTLPPGATLEQLWQKVIHERYAHDPDGLQRAADAAQAETQARLAAGLPLQVVAASAASYFGKNLQGAAPGHMLMAAALLVAGQADAVLPVEGMGGPGQPLALDTHKLTAGMQEVVRGGSTAVDDARSMNEGIDQKLSMHRTFVFKR